jgi:hypothetical protein
VKYHGKLGTSYIIFRIVEIFKGWFLFQKQISLKENGELLEYWGMLVFEMESSKLNNHSEKQWLNVSKS